MTDCESITGRLAESALDALAGGESEEIREHVSRCVRCAARLEALRRTRALLDSVPVPEAAPVVGAAIRAAAAAASDAAPPPALPLVRSIRGARVAAAAALLIAIAALGVALDARRQREDRPPERTPDPGIPTEVLADALADVGMRLAALEQRHDRDLFLLARAVDDERMESERGLAVRLAALRTATRDELARTRLALDGVAALVIPASTSPEER